MAPKKAPLSDVAIKALIAQGVAEHWLIMKLTKVVEMAMIATIQEVAEGELCLLLVRDAMENTDENDDRQVLSKE
ncbi:hypothetical protein Tco_0229379 [Tanacetum coccineum]